MLIETLNDKEEMRTPFDHHVIELKNQQWLRYRNDFLQQNIDKVFEL